MELTTVAVQNLLSPVILFFFLGIAAGLSRSSLTIPPGLSKGVSLYLMMAIGFRGGVELSHTGLTSTIAWACLAAAALSATLPLLAFGMLRATTRLDGDNAASVAAHYGSVSVVTFAASIAVLRQMNVPFEPYVVTLLAVMEAPAILTGLWLAKRSSGGGGVQGPVLRDVLLHGSVVLLLGSFVVGWLTGAPALTRLEPVFVAPFEGVLCVFMLDMGLLVASRFGDLRALSVPVAAFAVYMPLVGAAAGLGVSAALGLSPGGATALTVLSASASYIVVPAVMRGALPTASPALGLALSLGITFPFNLVVGIPLYHSVATLALAEPVASEARLEVASAENDPFANETSRTCVVPSSSGLDHAPAGICTAPH